MGKFTYGWTRAIVTSIGQQNEMFLHQIFICWKETPFTERNIEGYRYYQTIMTMYLQKEQWRQVHEDKRSGVAAGRLQVTGTSGLIATWPRNGSVIIIGNEGVHLCHKPPKIQSRSNRSCVEVVITNDDVWSRSGIEVASDPLLLLLVDFGSVGASSTFNNDFMLSTLVFLRSLSSPYQSTSSFSFSS